MPYLDPTHSNVASYSAIGQEDTCSQPASRSYLDLSKLTPHEWFDHISSSVKFPDLAVFREQARAQLGASALFLEIENQAFELLKQSHLIVELKQSFTDAVDTLVMHLSPVGLKSESPNYNEQKREQANKLGQGLNIISARLDLSQDSRVTNNFQNFRLRATEAVGRQIIILSVMVRKLVTANTHPFKKSQDALELIKSCLFNIFGESQMCGPGFTQKSLNEFDQLKMNLYPPGSLEEEVHLKRSELVRNVIGDFVATNYILPGIAPRGNEVHFVNAWQDYLIDNDPSFSSFTKIEDPISPIFRNDQNTAILKNKLLAKLKRHASFSSACLHLALVCQQKLESELGEKKNHIMSNFQDFNDAVKSIQKQYPSVRPEHFLDEDNDYELRKSETYLALHLLKQLPSNIFNPQVFLSTRDKKIYFFESLIWSETKVGNSEQLDIQFTDKESAFYEAGKTLFDSEESEQVLQGKIESLSKFLVGSKTNEIASFFKAFLSAEYRFRPKLNCSPKKLGQAESVLTYLATIFKVYEIEPNQSLKNLVFKNYKPRVCFETGQSNPKVFEFNGLYWTENDGNLEGNDIEGRKLYMSQSVFWVLAESLSNASEDQVTALANNLPKLSKLVLRTSQNDSVNFHMFLATLVGKCPGDTEHLNNPFISSQLSDFKEESDFLNFVASLYLLDGIRCGPEEKQWASKQLASSSVMTDFGAFKLFHVGPNNWIEVGNRLTRTVESPLSELGQHINLNGIQSEEQAQQKIDFLNKVGSVLLNSKISNSGYFEFFREIKALNESRINLNEFNDFKKALLYIQEPEDFTKIIALWAYSDCLNISPVFKQQLFAQGLTPEYILSESLTGKLPSTEIQDNLFSTLTNNIFQQYSLVDSIKLIAKSNSTKLIYDLAAQVTRISLVGATNIIKHRNIIKNISSLKQDFKREGNFKALVAIEIILKSLQEPFSYGHVSYIFSQASNTLLSNSSDEFVYRLFQSLDYEAIRHAFKFGLNPNKALMIFKKRGFAGQKVSITPLRVAINLDSPELVKILLENGAVSTAPTIAYKGDSLTPIEYVRDIMHNQNLLEILNQHNQRLGLN